MRHAGKPAVNLYYSHVLVMF